MDKVVLPKKVADEIKKCRSGYSDIDLMGIAISDSDCKVYEHMQAFAREDFETFLKAIANGYEIEMTPEEKVYEYYYEHTENSDEKVGVRRTLALLGIKIEGVNT